MNACRHGLWLLQDTQNLIRLNRQQFSVQPSSGWPQMIYRRNTRCIDCRRPRSPPHRFIQTLPSPAPKDHVTSNRDYFAIEPWQRSAGSAGARKVHYGLLCLSVCLSVHGASVRGNFKIVFSLNLHPPQEHRRVIASCVIFIVILFCLKSCRGLQQDFKVTLVVY